MHDQDSHLARTLSSRFALRHTFEPPFSPFRRRRPGRRSGVRPYAIDEVVIIDVTKLVRGVVEMHAVLDQVEGDERGRDEV